MTFFWDSMNLIFLLSFFSNFFICNDDWVVFVFFLWIYQLAAVYRKNLTSPSII